MSCYCDCLSSVIISLLYIVFSKISFYFSRNSCLLRSCSFAVRLHKGSRCGKKDRMINADLDVPANGAAVAGNWIQCNSV